MLFADWTQSGASIRLTVWKWPDETRYPGALPPVLENFRCSFSPEQTDCPWVSEDDEGMDGRMDIWVVDMDGWIDGYQWLDTAIT